MSRFSEGLAELCLPRVALTDLVILEYDAGRGGLDLPAHSLYGNRMQGGGGPAAVHSHRHGWLVELTGLS